MRRAGTDVTLVAYGGGVWTALDGAEALAGEWLVKPGDVVRRGDIVAVVDTAKAEIDVEIFEDGVIGELLVPPGTRVPVGTVLAEVRGVAGEPPAPAPQPSPAAAAGPAPRPVPGAADPGVLNPSRPLREQIELDAMEFLWYLTAVANRTGVEIPEADYDAVRTLDGCVEYVATHAR